MNITDILTVVLLILASALCIALIYYNFMIAKSVRAMSSNFEKISNKINSFIDSAQEISKKIDDVADEIDSQLKVSGSVVTDVREFGNKLLSVESKMRDGIEETIIPLAKNLRALGKGVSSFWKNYKK
ncbi:MAG: hypothetical protein U5K00_23440 [Melioribacteraceae bacterium]|nr:hypothetical protein [Melioribacteraceae bacterium]